MKRISDEDYIPIECEIVDINGKTVRVKSRPLSLEELEEVENLRENKEDGLTNAEIARRQLAKYFGGESDDYKKYSDHVAIQLLRYYTAETKR